MFSKNISFHNWSKDDFVGTFGKQQVTFKAGKTYSVPIDTGLHFAKHLAQLELNKAGKENFTIDPPSQNYKEYFDRALPANAVQQPFEEISYEEENLNVDSPIITESPKKITKSTKKTKDEEFED
jgi:hypothetical protein